MGLAATQMRFLALTAKKSNSEYQGQQINQQRLNLANQSSDIYTTLADLTVPVPPAQPTCITSASTATGTPLEGAVFNASGNVYGVTVTSGVATPNSASMASAPSVSTTTPYYVIKNSFVTSTGAMSTKFYMDTDANNVFDAAYKDYEDSLRNYNGQMAQLEAESSNVQQKDKKLELQLKRIDTEHSAIQTEVDAIKKVLDDNIESSFKTFS